MNSIIGKRILILAPHPDDEVVACCATIGRTKLLGASCFVLFLTNGCKPKDIMWPWQRSKHEKKVTRRRKEAEKTAQALGIEIVDFSDRSARHLWRHLPAAWSEIQQAIAAYNIDQLWVPAYEGGNADHDGLNGLASMLQSSVSVLEFASYNFAGGQARSHRFPFPNGTETALQLTPVERAFKKECLKLYQSEKINLHYVKTEKETFRPLAVYDYSQPAHGGTMWYNRFDWVPFPHPGVDRTKPKDVSRAIGEVLSFFEEATCSPESAKQSTQEHKAASHDSAE